ncbi:hypothetical protein E2C01_100814 [Portunus trituberculatus]|uniref:Uncharacterized protein n=1 Tax=Portunus trituberculatus TaxID=210409 RepID=A0A5B7KIW1_PORTR|nr:hypothetical protein [Portunus trituberculatus]
MESAAPASCEQTEKAKKYDRQLRTAEYVLGEGVGGDAWRGATMPSHTALVYITRTVTTADLVKS